MDFDTRLNWGALIGAAIVFLVGLYQWADTRRKDIEQKHFEQFHRAFEWVAGRMAAGQLLVDVQQAMDVYELANFPEYKDISVPILGYSIAGKESSSLFRQALLHTKAKLGDKPWKRS
jgi:hypothetical protein